MTKHKDVSELPWGAPVSTAKTVRDGFAETFAYTEFPPEHWRRIRTNNGIEHIDREIRRRTRPSGPTRTATRPSCWCQRD